MLNRTKNERACVGVTEFEWLALSTIEQRLVRLYRQLSEPEQKQLRRLTEVLVTNAEEPSGS